MRNNNIIFLLLLTLGFFSLEAAPKNAYNRFLPKKELSKGDTVSVIKNELEAPDFLLEKAIDPEKYVLGPGDVLHLNIMTGMNLEWDIPITPDGRAIVPSIGTFDLKNKTLREAEIIIIEKSKQKYKSDEIGLVLNKIRKFKVMVSGDVTKPMSVPVCAADRVSDAISKAGGLKSTSSLRYINLIRDNKTILVDLLKYYQLGDEQENPTLLGGDFISVMNRNDAEYIKIDGEVFSPDIFEYKKGDSLSTLIRLSQGFKQSAFLDSVEFVRENYITISNEHRYINLNNWSEYFESNRRADLMDFPLQPGDKIYVRKKPNWQKEKYVIVEGEVKYPGQYSITENQTTLLELIDRAGGLTKDGSAENSILIRQLAYKEQDLDMTRLRSLPPSEMSQNERKYYVARSSEIPGRIAVDFVKLLEGKAAENNVLLLDRDSLYIPKTNLFVNVGGRVNNPGRVAYKKEYTYEDYIKLAGGYGYRAEESATLVVKPKGQQYKAKNKNYTIEPGDNIFVLTETDTTFFEVFTTALTIVTQLLTVVAVIFTVLNTKK